MIKTYKVTLDQITPDDTARWNAVEADTWEIDELGTLIFCDELGNLVVAYAQGVWRTFEVVQEVPNDQA